MTRCNNISVCKILLILSLISFALLIPIYCQDDETVLNLRAHSTGYNDAVVQWELPAGLRSDINCVKVYVTGPEIREYLIKGRETTQFKLKNLEPSTSYCVKGALGKSVGEKLILFAKSSAVCFRTHTGVHVIEEISKLELSRDNSSSVSVDGAVQVPIVFSTPTGISSEDGRQIYATVMVSAVSPQEDQRPVASITHTGNISICAARCRRSAELPGRKFLSGPYSAPTNDSYEILLPDEITKKLSPTSSSEIHYVVGTGFGLPKSSHNYNGPLTPNTDYSIRIRIYGTLGVATSRPLYVHTDALSLLVVYVFTTIAAAVAAFILFLIVCREVKRHREYTLLNSIEREIKKPHVEEMQSIEEIVYVEPGSEHRLGNRIVRPVGVSFFDTYVDRLISSPNDFVGLQYRFLTVTAVRQSEFFFLTTQLGARCRKCVGYSKFLPFDQSVVLLDCSWPIYRERLRTVLPSVEFYKDVYCDASYVVRCDYNPENGSAILPSLSKLPEFIAAGSPTPHCEDRFLSMIVQQRSTLVFMLDGLTDTAACLTCRYWPGGEVEEFGTRSSPCKVELIKELIKPYYIRRTLSVQSSKLDKEWTFEQIQFLGWLNRRTPRMDIFYDCVNVFLREWVEQKKAGGCGPPIIHSSSDDGKCGTLICALFLLERLRYDPKFLDVFGTVLAVRKFLWNTVQDKTHLKFLYRFVQYCLTVENVELITSHSGKGIEKPHHDDKKTTHGTEKLHQVDTKTTHGAEKHHIEEKQTIPGSEIRPAKAKKSSTEVRLLVDV